MHRRTSRHRALVFLSGLCGILGQPRGAAAAGVHCDQVEMQADEATCSGGSCTLQGHAQLRCASLWLQADRIDVQRQPNGRFAGAQATGQVVLTQKQRVFRAASLELAADRIAGVVEAASLDVFAEPLHKAADGRPTGRRCMVSHGRLRRDAPHHLIMEPGDFTLCDCGPNRLPSWRLDSSRVDIDWGERVTLWGPQLRIHLPGTNFMLPVTPPLLPLSLPLRARASGFLPPLLRFYGGWPTVDLPIFLPLGASYDLLLSPGLRTDWARWRPIGPSSVGAPRLGFRLRYVPSTATSGSLEGVLTHDGAGRMAANLEAADRLRGTPAPPAMYARRRALRERLRVDWLHRSRLRDGLFLSVDARWVSDDLVLQDFAMATPERFATYWPSRAALSWSLPQSQIRLAADWLLRLDNLRPVGGEPPLLLPAYSNTDGSEAGTMQRGPDLGISLLPTHLLPGVLVDASLNLVRLGPWSNRPPHPSFFLTPAQRAANPLQAQALFGQTAGLSLAQRVHGLSLRARSGIDALWIWRQANPDAAADRLFDAAWVSQADAELTLRRRFFGGQRAHLLRPRLSYRGLPWHHGSPSPLDNRGSPQLDERLSRRRSHQLAGVLRQSWVDEQTQADILMLELGQPVDLRRAQWLQPYAELRLIHPLAGAASLFASYDPQPGQPIRWREISLQWGGAVGPVGLDLTYQKLAPDADRFERGIYELASPRLLPQLDRDASPGNWVHAVRGGMATSLGAGFSATYRTAVQLPRPGQLGGDVGCASPQQRGPAAAQRAAGLPVTAPRFCFTEHRVSLDYTSPCQCWGFSSFISWVPQDPQSTLRMQVLFNLAGLSFSPT